MHFSRLQDSRKADIRFGMISMVFSLNFEMTIFFFPSLREIYFYFFDITRYLFETKILVSEY